MEEQRFARTLKKASRIRAAVETIEASAFQARREFRLYDTFGFSAGVTRSWPGKGFDVDEDGYHAAFAGTQKKSRRRGSSASRAALRNNEGTEIGQSCIPPRSAASGAAQVLREDGVAQKGRNITAERLRFDFSFPRKMTPEGSRGRGAGQLSHRVGRTIACDEMTVEEAKESGAIGLFESRYAERVKVYTMGDFSKESAAARTRAIRASWGISPLKRKKRPARACAG
jgi:alanyl-tRNA synthetase